MCGIYGFLGTAPKQKRVNLLRSLAVFNEKRGSHSSGIAAREISTKADKRVWNVNKTITPASDAINNREFGKVMNHLNSDLFLGHCRFATVGSIKRQNAHPFSYGKTVGIHNGTVSNLKEVYKHAGGKYSVDSQALIDLVDKEGHTGPAKGKLNLAYSSMHNEHDLILSRHGHTLAMAYCKKWSWVAFSSDAGHLEMALAIAGLDGDVYKLQDETTWGYTLLPDGTVEETEIAHISTIQPKKNYYYAGKSYTSKYPKKTGSEKPLFSKDGGTLTDEELDDFLFDLTDDELDEIDECDLAEFLKNRNESSNVHIPYDDIDLGDISNLDDTIIEDAEYHPVSAEAKKQVDDGEPVIDLKDLTPEEDEEPASVMEEMEDLDELEQALVDFGWSVYDAKQTRNDPALREDLRQSHEHFLSCGEGEAWELG